MNWKDLLVLIWGVIAICAVVFFLTLFLLGPVHAAIDPNDPTWPRPHSSLRAPFNSSARHYTDYQWIPADFDPTEIGSAGQGMWHRVR